ncbi:MULTISPECIES: alpha/beta hydrolase [Mycolicibacterium]|uniref:Alpha/beta hydrolase fold-3 domain protein n=1 Tax=Mycobacterium sp. (strain JLS) TaxID=164757 RepID=A0A5Q5CHZ1_MYCSJ|nr:alpha/beta hydrolase [Mycolicibacterium monacense]OBB66253.1 alpha/beta hydrolase [Mycolicibacterium monacense]OBF52506.1 alpha/beta hydrolase [Mycolicibacterium monacense]
MKRSAAAVIGGATAAVAAGRYLLAREALSAVARDLRSPVLPYVAAPSSRRSMLVTRAFTRLPTPAGDGVTVTESRVGETAVRVVITAPAGGGTSRPAVMWIHSGGFVVGSPQLERFITGQIARELGATVVSPDYRLAPEHAVPAALDDCMATLRWMRTNADRLGIDADRIVVGGASAGGGLAATVAQRSLDEGCPLRGQALAYPMLDDRSVLRADHGGRGRFVWTPASNRFGWTAYLGHPPDTSEAPAYAAAARRSELSGLAPAWIGVGQLDLLHDDCVSYAERLESSGVPCELITVPGMYHAADAIAARALSMQTFRASMLNFMRARLS